MTSESSRRKQLKRTYLETPRTMGAYVIRCTLTDKAYVGVSRDVNARLNRHRFMLNNSSEELADLQADWNGLGADAFEFAVLEVLEPPQDQPSYDPSDDLETLLRLWCDELQTYAPAGYNLPA